MEKMMPDYSDSADSDSTMETVDINVLFADESVDDETFIIQGTNGALKDGEETNPWLIYKDFRAQFVALKRLPLSKRPGVKALVRRISYLSTEPTLPKFISYVKAEVHMNHRNTADLYVNCYCRAYFDTHFKGTWQNFVDTLL